MPRKYSAEFKEKAIHQVLEMVRRSPAHGNARTRKSESSLACPTTRYAPGTVTASPMSRRHQQVAKPWKKSSKGYAGKTAS